MTVENPWAESVVHKLLFLWNEGKTASEIARDLNKEFNTRFTRNAVISKGRKLGVQRRRASPSGWESKNIKPLPASKISEIQADSLRTDLKSLLDLAPDECKWGIHDPKDERFGFCARIRKPGSPYCKVHDKRAYTVSKIYDPKKHTKNF